MSSDGFWLLRPDSLEGKKASSGGSSSPQQQTHGGRGLLDSEVPSRCPGYFRSEKFN